MSLVNALVKVCGAGQPFGGLRRVPVIPLEEITQGIPVFAVPLGPAVIGREIADLIEPARVPGLGDQLGGPEDGIIRQTLQQGRVLHGNAVLVTAQDTGQVKTEAVHMVFGDPVFETVDDELPDNGVIAVKGIAAAAEVVILPGGHQHVIDVIVKALEGQEGSVLIAFGRMVEDNVQDDLDPVLFQDLDGLFQLCSLFVVFQRSREGGVGGKEGNGIVAPVLHQLFAVDGAGIDGLIKFKDRHQLDSRDPQLLQIGDLLHDTRKGAGILDTGGTMPGKTPDMHLIDDGVLHGRSGKSCIVPLEVIMDDPGLIGRGSLGGAPGTLAGHSPGIGIQDQFGLIEQKALFRIIGTVKTVAVFKVLDDQAEYHDGIYHADPVFIRDLDHGIGIILMSFKKAQLAGGRSNGGNRKIDASLHLRSPVDLKIARSYLESRYFSRGFVDLADPSRFPESSAALRPLSGLPSGRFRFHLLYEFSYDQISLHKLSPDSLHSIYIEKSITRI